MKKTNFEKSKTLKPYFQEEIEIIRKKHLDGSMTYHKQNDGEEIQVNHQDLWSIIDSTLDKFRNLVSTLNVEDYTRYGSLFDTLIQHSEWYLGEVRSVIFRDVGTIQCALISFNELQSIYRPLRALGAEIVPADADIEAVDAKVI